jgi:hypothetical protein
VIPLLTRSIDPSPCVRANYRRRAETDCRDSRNSSIQSAISLMCRRQLNTDQCAAKTGQDSVAVDIMKTPSRKRWRAWE